MGSSYCGMPNMSGDKTTSSRKSKKNGSSDKPKQPQRGLGVAQLEQIRLRTQLGCAFPPPNSLIHPGTAHVHGLVPEEMRMQGVPYGVAQSSSSSYPPYSQSSLPSTSSPYGHHHPNFMMLFGDERANLRYQDSQTSATRWNPNNNAGLLDSSSHYGQGDMGSRHLFSHYEDSRRPMDSNNRNSDSSEHEEVDLELRLSI